MDEADYKAQQKAIMEARAPGASRRFPVIQDPLRVQLAAITPTRLPGNVELRGCRVVLRSGQHIDRVVFMDADEYLQASWIMWPEDIWGQVALPLSDVVSIRESLYRLPAHLATAVWQAGERFGTYVFTLVLKDGRRLPYAVDLPDFPILPPGITKHDCVAVDVDEYPPAFVDRQATPEERAAMYGWCLYRNA